MPAKSGHKPRRKAASYLVSPFKAATPLVFTMIVAGVLIYGWLNRNEHYLTAEEGLGYNLGIAGAVMMLALLLYPLRKRSKMMRKFGRVSQWFQIHMLLGILGPMLILFHANFHLKSLNSTVALISMLLVAGSGIIGRYLYTRIHLGLYGKRAHIQEILQDAQAFKQALGIDLEGAPAVARKLRAYEQQVLVPRQGMLESFWFVIRLSMQARRYRADLAREVRDIVRVQARRHGWRWRERRRRRRAAIEHLSEYLGAVRKAAQFAFYERLFALWHILHLPLFNFLILAAIVHVIAVHLY